MNNKDRQVLEKIYNHVTSVLNYCEKCRGLDKFQADAMNIVWDTIHEDLPLLKTEIEKYLDDPVLF